MLGAVLLGVFGPLVAMPLAVVERLRLQIVRTVRITSGHRQPPSVGLWPWLRTRYTEAATWREVAYAGVLATVVPAGYGVLTLFLVVDGVLIASPLLGGAPGGPVSVGVGEITTAKQALPYAAVGVVLLPLGLIGLTVLAGLHGAV
nr:sensor domain-containing protein [Micromonospora sp. DSM 115978]